MHWAVFSSNLWPHDEANEYARRLGSAAESFIEKRHKLRLTGCSGVPFLDKTLAIYSRERTVKLHRKMGDRIYFFQIPSDLAKR